MARRRQPPQPQQPVEWHFFSFPVAFGFSLGAFLATLLTLITAGGVLDLLWIATLFSTSFGLAHIVSHWVRNRTINRRLTQAEEDERERRALAAREAAATPAPGEPPPARRRRRRR